MSPYRSRLREMLVASGLAEKDLERERVKAQRDSNAFKSTVDGLRSLVPVAADLYTDNVNRTEAKAEKERLEKRDDAALIAKLTREDSRDAAKRKHDLDVIAAKNAAAARAAADVDVPDDETSDAVRSMKMSRAFGKVRDDLDAENVNDGARASAMADALARVDTSTKTGSSLSSGASDIDKREERRLQMLARIAADPRKRGVLDQEAWDDLATIGITKPSAPTSTGPKTPTDKQRKDKALADAAEARARSAAVKARNDENPTQRAPDTKEKGKQRQIASAKHLLAEIERTHKEYKASASGPATGRGVGFVRGIFTGVLPGMEESKRAKFLANSEGLNAMLFPILGREDAPADAETKRLAPLRIDENTTDAELEAKLATLRGMIEAQEHALNMGAAANAGGAQSGATDKAARRRTRIGELRAAGVAKEQARAILAQEGLLQ